MPEHLFKNWIIYVLLGGFVWFVGYLIIISWKQARKERAERPPDKK